MPGGGGGSRGRARSVAGRLPTGQHLNVNLSRSSLTRIMMKIVTLNTDDRDQWGKKDNSISVMMMIMIPSDGEMIN